MISNDTMPLSDHSNPRRPLESAIALVDDQGTVVAWTDAAERLVGYAAGDVVGRSAGVVLPLTEDVPTVAAFVEQCHPQSGWSGLTQVRRRDGLTLNVNLRVSMVSGQDGAVRWLVSVNDVSGHPSEAALGSIRESLLTRAPIGVVVRDTDLRCAWVNETMAGHDGVSRDTRLGCRFTEALPGSKSEALEAVMRQVLLSGTTKVHQYRMWPATSPRRDHTFAASFFCLQGADGRPLGMCTINADLTESRRAQERLAVLSEAGARLGSTLDVMQTSQELADLAVPLLADYAAVDLEQSVPCGQEPPARIGSDRGHPPVFRRAGLASIHREVPESPWARGDSIAVQSLSPFTEVLRTGRSHLEPILDTAPGTWIDHDGTRARKIRENGIHSLMVVPIRARRTVLGVAVFVRTENSLPFQELDLLLAEELADRAALSLANARRYTRERSAALTLQRALLPHRLGGGAAVETASRYLPADMDSGVGGDWFDVISLSGARVAMVVGDVVGHGITAAATMGRLRTAVHTLADTELAPDDLLTHLDDTVQRLAEEEADDTAETPAVVGATCLYAVYDPVTRRCTMARAGHPPPAVINPQGHVVFPDIPSGAPLGLGLGVPFESVELELPEGSLLALYTDGLVETRDADISTGMDRLGSALAEPDRDLEDLCTRAIEFSAERAPCDDATLLLVRTRSLDPARVASWTLPNSETAARDAREVTASQLADWGVEDLAESTRLIVSELVTNAVRHSRDPIGLRLIQHQVLTCEVFDTDTCPPRQQHALTVDEHGRGLFLVAQLARRWGSRTVAGGKVVWAEEELAHTPSPAGAPGHRGNR
ncbi:PAS domain S-box-containing protein [Actinacidiphila rubida]|uniref:protein-serine/threonine phosphatase n=2 Tax=Actinacidiphila rubida TaxID=310780 RepID=A0A1H8K974_9ACTN|nr:PAS domain S-box-containing protein [Actinacidiphila rubida]